MTTVDFEGFAPEVEGATRGVARLRGALDDVLQLQQNVVFVCEGYATGISLHLATGAPVVVAFNAKKHAGLRK